MKTARTEKNLRYPRLGRSAGIHLVISTQRPDISAVEPQVRANLSGVVCFRAATLASSYVIIGEKRASELPAEIPGRAVWKTNSELVEVQTPYISTDSIYNTLQKKEGSAN